VVNWCAAVVDNRRTHVKERSEVHRVDTSRPAMSVAKSEPYDKKKRKQKMTAEQLTELESKQLRVVAYDSDDEPVRCSTPTHIRHARVAAVETLASAQTVNVSMSTDCHTFVVHFTGGSYSPVREEEPWERDLTRLLDEQRGARSPPRVRRPNNRDLFGDLDSLDDNTDDDDVYIYKDSSELVPDPFNTELRCTAAERDVCLEEEQEYRRSNGLPLLVPNPLDREHWIEPSSAASTAVIDEVPVNLPPMQVTPPVELLCNSDEAPVTPER